MRANSFTKILAGVGIGAFLTVFLVLAPAQSAGQQKPLVKQDVPDGYVLVKQDELRQLVHEEVTRQLKDFFTQVRREQQQQQAVARVSATGSIANSLRSQIALYRLQHNDQSPSLQQIGDGFKFLTLRTDAAGNPSDGPNAFGPYLQHIATNPLTGKSKVAALGKATTDAGWSYDPQTGMVKAVVPKQLESQIKDRVSPRDIEFAGVN